MSIFHAGIRRRFIRAYNSNLELLAKFSERKRPITGRASIPASRIKMLVRTQTLPGRERRKESYWPTVGLSLKQKVIERPTTEKFAPSQLRSPFPPGRIWLNDAVEYCQYAPR